MLIVSTLLLMLKAFFKTPDASNPSSHTRPDSTDLNYPKSFTKLVAGTATIFTLGKPSEYLKWYYDQKIISFFSSDFESVFAKHPTGKILSFVFYPKAVYFECKFWISRSAITHVQN